MQKLLERITTHQEIHDGVPIVLGTRIAVVTVLSSLAQGMSTADLLQDHPDLEEEDIRACLAYAAFVVQSSATITTQTPEERLLGSVLAESDNVAPELNRY